LKTLLGKTSRAVASLRAVIGYFRRSGSIRSGEQGMRFVIHPRPFGLPGTFRYDDVEELIEELEGEAYR
jgi:hypothetical protein